MPAIVPSAHVTAVAAASADARVPGTVAVVTIGGNIYASVRCACGNVAVNVKNPDVARALMMHPDALRDAAAVTAVRARGMGVAFDVTSHRVGLRDLACGSCARTTLAMTMSTLTMTGEPTRIGDWCTAKAPKGMWDGAPVHTSYQFAGVWAVRPEVRLVDFRPAVVWRAADGESCHDLMVRDYQRGDVARLTALLDEHGVEGWILATEIAAADLRLALAAVTERVEDALA